MAGTMQDAYNALPLYFSASQQWNPQFQGLNLQQLQSALFGTPAGQTTENMVANQAGYYNSAGQYLGAGGGTGANGAPTNRDRLGQATGKGMGTAPPTGGTFYNAGQTIGTRTVNQAAQPGLIGMLQDVRGAELASLNALAPQAYSAMRAANPDQYALLDPMNTQARGDLALGGALNDDQTRRMQQMSRQAMAARGMSGSNQAIADELFRTYDLGNELQRQRQQFALGVGQLNQAASLDPFSSVLGTGNNLMSMGAGVMGQNPLAQLLGMAQDNAMTAYNAQASANNAKANNKSGLFGGLLGLGGSLGAAALTPAPITNFRIG